MQFFFAGAVEVKNYLSASLGMELPATLIFDYPTIAALTTFVLSLSHLTGATAGTGSPQLGAGPGAGIVSKGTGKPDEATSAPPDYKNVLEVVTSTFVEILGQSIAPDQPFAAAGLDSLAAVEARNVLNRSFSPAYHSKPATAYSMNGPDSNNNPTLPHISGSLM